MSIKGVLAGVGLGSLALGCSALAVDITIQDPHLDKSFSGQQVWGPEDGTVEYDAVANQSWDLEKFVLQDSSLSLVGGFNFLTGIGVGASEIYPQGDIFIYTGQQPYATDSGWTGKDDWSYVVQFARNGNNNILETEFGIGYQILARSEVNTVLYTQDPRALLKGLPWISTGTLTSTSYGGYTGFNDGGGLHYSISEIDLSGILALEDDLYLHTTMRCGNDVLWGQVGNSVPDGGLTLAMLGLGLMGVAAVRRKM
jgi:hypothetical protein